MKCTPDCVKPPIGTKIQHCGVCHRTYTSPSLGDAHRVAAEVDERGRRVSYRDRCLTDDEQLARGWRLDDRGRWRGPASGRFDNETEEVR